MHGLSHLGPEGYHWRVCVEDKPAPGDHSSSSSRKSYSWWDIQDENAVLPVKEASSYQLNKFFAPHEKDTSVSETATKAAKGAFKSLGKALAGTDGVDHGPPVCVIAFKLLDLVKVHDDFHGRGGRIPSQPTSTPRPAAPPRAPQSAPVPRQTPAVSRSAPPRQTPVAPRQGRAPPAAPAADLMGFHSPTASAPSSRSSSMSRPERLNHEMAKKHAQAKRVWDPVDERWVEVEKPKHHAASVPRPGAQKLRGVSLDESSAFGKPQHVQDAVGKRVQEMRDAQNKAKEELRQRKEKEEADANAEDEVRKRLEPRIKEWSEEHGKKKQLRALLGTLHTILWPEAKWKQISIGDMLDDSKCKKFYHKATLVVHPDKTHHLDAEKRFLAKRIFDALSQAKVEFDAGKK